MLLNDHKKIVFSYHRIQRIQPFLEKIIFYHYKMHYYQQILFTKKRAKKKFLHFSYLLEDLLDLIQTEDYSKCCKQIKKKIPTLLKKGEQKLHAVHLQLEKNQKTAHYLLTPKNDHKNSKDTQAIESIDSIASDEDLFPKNFEKILKILKNELALFLDFTSIQKAGPLTKNEKKYLAIEQRFPVKKRKAIFRDNWDIRKENHRRLFKQKSF